MGQGEGATAHRKCPVAHLAEERGGRGEGRGGEEGKPEQQTRNLTEKGEQMKRRGGGRGRREKMERESDEGSGGGQERGEQT